MRHQTLISLASNCDQEAHLAEARSRLDRVLEDTRYTEAIWTEPVGSRRSDLYLNQLLRASTTLDVQQLQSMLKAIETQMGRSIEERQQGIVRIDIDLLQYDDERYHLRDWERPYIKKLLRKT